MKLNEQMEMALPAIAKVSRPMAARLLARPRLFAALDEAQQTPATWICAPPGFGKTSLVTSYVQHHGMACLWFRIDGEDADIGNLFYYLKQAAAALPRVDGPNLPDFSPENLPSLGAFARRFFEALLLRLQAPAVLVFDDYQEVAADAPLHKVLAKVVEHAPAGIRVIFLSREQPPPAYARPRAHGALALLDADALTLDAEESQALAECMRRGRTDREVVARLNELAGGWVAGLMLLLERGDRPLPALLPGTATLQVVFDYFSREIFHNLAPDVQSLLLQCALLPDMPGEVLHSLTGTEAARRLLDQLSARSYFTTRHEGATAVYRFHPLFRIFLLEQAENLLPRDRRDALQLQAAHTLAEAGYADDAVLLMRACEDWGGLSRIVLGHAEQFARQGRLQTLQAWIRLLPEPVVEDSGWLLFWLGSSLTPFDPLAARLVLQRAHARFAMERDVAGLYLSWAGVATVFNFTLASRDECLGWISAFATLQDQYPDFPAPEIEAKVALGLVALFMLYGLDHERLPYWLARCRKLLSYHGDHSTRLVAGHQLSWLYSWLGKGAEGAALVREMAQLATSSVAPLARLSYLDAVAMVAWHQADAESCAAAVDQALHLADESDLHLLDPYLGVIGIYGALTVGDTAAAGALLVRFENAAVSPRLMDASAHSSMRLLVNLHSGNREEALRYARETCAINEKLSFVFGVFLSQIYLVSALLAHGRAIEAEAALTSATRLVQGIDSPVMAHLLHLGRALAACMRGDCKNALVCLRDACWSARNAGGHYTPLYQRESLAELYALGLDVNLEVDFLRNQIRRQRLAPPASAPECWPWPIKVFTLGRFAIAKDGIALRSGAKSSRKPMELLKVLIALGGRGVHQERLVTALWPDAVGDDAHHSFETTLYRLRKLLGAEALFVKDGHLTLNPTHCWVDCWAFERLVSRVGAAVDAKDGAAAMADARRLLDLYQGPFLDRDRDIPLAVAHEERLRSRMLRLLDKLAEFWTARDEAAKALECYQRALEADPRAEAFYQGLMRCYHAQGRHAEAIAVFQRCRLALHSLIGVAPSAESQALHAAALAAANTPAAIPDAG